LTSVKDYRDRYSCVRMERAAGILLLVLRTNEDTLRWAPIPPRELPEAFNDVTRDPDNGVIMLTGAESAFSQPQAEPHSWPSKTPSERNEMRMGLGTLDTEGPMIAAVNGHSLRAKRQKYACVAQCQKRSPGEVPGEFRGTRQKPIRRQHLADQREFERPPRVMRVCPRRETTERFFRDKGTNLRGASTQRIRNLPYRATWRSI
jgi:hypothetical protein